MWLGEACEITEKRAASNFFSLYTNNVLQSYTN